MNARKVAAALALAVLAVPIVLAAPGKKAARPVIAFYGDSTIRGYQSHSGKQVAVSLTDAFAQAVGNGYEVRNEGADSSRVEHLLAGRDGRHGPWANYIAAANVDIVVTNHASKNGNPVGQYKRDMRTMLRLARKHGKRVILMTPTPIVEGGLDAYVEAMRALAAEEAVPLIDVYAFLQRHAAANGLAISDIVPDGYHPADEVYALAGRYAAAQFMALEQAARRPVAD